jgi:hypothetical protein
MMEGEARKIISDTFNRCWMYYNFNKGILWRYTWLDSMISVLYAAIKTYGVGGKYSMGQDEALRRLDELRDQLDDVVKAALQESKKISKETLMARFYLELSRISREVIEIYIRTGFIVSPLSFDEDGFEQLKSLIKEEG